MQAESNNRNQSALATEAGALRAARWILGLGFLAIIALTPNLWISHREVPLVPIADLIGPFTSPWDRILLFAFIIALGSTLVAPSKAAVSFILAQIIVWVFQDQNRIMPWMFQFGLMYLILARYLVKSGSAEIARRTVDTLSCVVVCMYFWSGILKFNVAFRSTIAPSLLEPLAGFGISLDIIVVLTGVLAPCFECACALALLFRSTRRIGVLGLESMHLLILLSLGPWGLNFNSSVWPWNVLMMALIPTLLWKSTSSARDILGFQRDALKSAMVLLVGILPVLKVFGLWETYLSFGMYIGNITNGEIIVNSEAVNQLPASLRRRATPSDSDPKHFQVDMGDWVLSELNSPPNPEERIFRALGQWCCTLGLPPDSLAIRITRWDWLLQTTPNIENFDCNDGTLKKRDNS